MNIKVVFDTIIGRTPVDAELEFSMSEDFLNGVEDSWKNGLTANVSICKPDMARWYEGHQHYKVDFSLAVMGDIRALREQNNEYAAKEDNGRHQVDLRTLEVNEIWVKGKFLLIEWKFKDCYGCCRLFHGNAYPITERDHDGENYYCSLPMKLQVYF